MKSKCSINSWFSSRKIFQPRKYSSRILFEGSFLKARDKDQIFSIVRIRDKTVVFQEFNDFVSWLDLKCVSLDDIAVLPMSDQR